MSKQLIHGLSAIVGAALLAITFPALTPAALALIATICVVTVVGLVKTLR